MFPAARKGDPISHDSIAPSGVVGPPPTGPCPPGVMGPVMIEMLPAAHVGCAVVCSGVISAPPGIIHPPIPPPPAGPPNLIVKGSVTVLIHNMPAARWVPSGDMTAPCGVFIGLTAAVAIRRTLIGG